MKLPIVNFQLPIEERLDELHVRFGSRGRLRLEAGRILIGLAAGIRRLGGRMVIDAVKAARFEWGRSN